MSIDWLYEPQPVTAAVTARSLGGRSPFCPPSRRLGSVRTLTGHPTRVSEGWATRLHRLRPCRNVPVGAVKSDRNGRHNDSRFSGAPAGSCRSGSISGPAVRRRALRAAVKGAVSRTDARSALACPPRTELNDVESAADSIVDADGFPDGLPMAHPRVLCSWWSGRANVQLCLRQPLQPGRRPAFRIAPTISICFWKLS